MQYSVVNYCNIVLQNINTHDVCYCRLQGLVVSTENRVSLTSGQFSRISGWLCGGLSYSLTSGEHNSLINKLPFILFCLDALCL
jgi:hypothetical protein